MKRTVAFVPALALVILLGAAACGGGEDATTPRDVVLMTHDSFSVSNDVLAEFETDTGFHVKVLKSGDAGAMVNQAVLSKDNPLGDVIYGIDNTFLSRAVDEGVFDPYDAAGADAIPGTFSDGTDGAVTPVDYGDVCLNYDRSYFTGERRPPRSLDDLTDPAYRDLTVVEDAALSSPGFAFVLATIGVYGDGWQGYWSRLKANGVRVAPDWETAYFTDYSVSGGDRPIVVSYASSPPAEIVSAEETIEEPLSGVVEEGCFRQVEYAGVLEGAKNPEGARALIDFMLTKRFQEDMPLQMFVFPVVPDAGVPPVFEQWAATPLVPVTMSPGSIGSTRNSVIEEWTDLVGA